MKYKVGDEVLVKCRINYVDNDVSLPYKVSGAGCISGFSKPLYILAGDDDIETMTAEEAWKLAIKLRYMDFEDKIELFNLDQSSSREAWLEIMENMSPESVRDKIEAWEAEKEIKVGDVVKVGCYTGLVVSDDHMDDSYDILFSDGGTSKINIKDLKKTGRRIDITGLLNQIGGDK